MPSSVRGSGKHIHKWAWFLEPQAQRERNYLRYIFTFKIIRTAKKNNKETPHQPKPLWSWFQTFGRVSTLLLSSVLVPVKTSLPLCSRDTFFDSRAFPQADCPSGVLVWTHKDLPGGRRVKRGVKTPFFPTALPPQCDLGSTAFFLPCVMWSFPCSFPFLRLCVVWICALQRYLWALPEWDLWLHLCGLVTS